MKKKKASTFRKKFGCSIKSFNLQEKMRLQQYAPNFIMFSSLPYFLIKQTPLSRPHHKIHCVEQFTQIPRTEMKKKLKTQCKFHELCKINPQNFRLFFPSFTHNQEKADHTNIKTVACFMITVPITSRVKQNKNNSIRTPCKMSEQE